jgi:hypothetical protein
MTIRDRAASVVFRTTAEAANAFRPLFLLGPNDGPPRPKFLCAGMDGRYGWGRGQYLRQSWAQGQSETQTQVHD